MAQGCGASCAKMLLIIFNFIFWLSGAGLLAVGIWILVDKNFTAHFDILESVSSSGALLKYAAYILIGVGAFVFLVGFLGCCGAIKESRCMLGLYIFCLVIVCAGELAAGVLMAIYKPKIINKLQDEWKEKLKDDYGQSDEEDKALTQAVDLFQMKMKCCGVVGREDYDNSEWQKSTANRKVPISCCVLKDGTNMEGQISDDDVKNLSGCQDKTAADSYYSEGCYEASKAWFEEHSTILIGVGIGIACLELFGFIFAILLCRNTTEE